MDNGDRRGLVLQHGNDGPPAILAEWLGERGISWQAHATWREALPADPSAFGWIATLGSEHTPGKSDAPQWVSDEVGFLAGALDAGVPVLGLCFGGQALAAAAGGAVTRCDTPEVGWMEIETDDPELVPAGPWLQYHYDQLELPPGSTALARSPAGPAAFALGPSLGLQFHPESTPEIAALWAAQDTDRLAGLGVDPQRLREQGERVAASAARAARRLFDAWWDKMGTSSRGS